MLIAICCVGCENTEPIQQQRGTSAAIDNSGENFAQAVYEVKAIEEFDADQSPPRIAYHLNRWIATQNPKPTWKEDALYQRLPPELKIHPVAKNLERMEFSGDDVLFIRHTTFINEAANWISAGDSEEPLASWFDSQRDSIGDVETTRLQMAERVFDWITRNVQLDELLPYAKEAAIGPIQQGTTDRNMLLPARRGEPGPGYRHLPGETLIFGHGDAWERAQLFILMCRQLDIDVVMLATVDEQRPGKPRPWLPAVLLGDKMYLFDTELGLPIPGPEGQGIATIEQARNNPQILDNLDLDDERPYRMHAADIDEVIALVDGTPFFLSQRLDVLADMLGAKDPIRFTASPEKIGERARKCSGVVSAKIWRASYEAMQYYVGKQRRIGVAGPARDEYLLNTFLFFQPNKLPHGRYYHLVHDFESTPEFDGAIGSYLNSRTSDAELDAFLNDPAFQAAVGIVKTPDQSDEQFARSIRERHSMQQRTKRDATLWLGNVNFEKEEYQAAASWFEDRILEKDPESFWVPSARYNLARCYEKLGDVQRARTLYFEDESAQSHGNVLRARWLRNAPEPQPEAPLQ